MGGLRLRFAQRYPVEESKWLPITGNRSAPRRQEAHRRGGECANFPNHRTPTPWILGCRRHKKREGREDTARVFYMRLSPASKIQFNSEKSFFLLCILSLTSAPRNSIRARANHKIQYLERRCLVCKRREPWRLPSDKLNGGLCKSSMEAGPDLDLKLRRLSPRIGSESENQNHSHANHACIQQSKARSLAPAAIVKIVVVVVVVVVNNASLGPSESLLMAE